MTRTPADDYGSPDRLRDGDHVVAARETGALAGGAAPPKPIQSRCAPGRPSSTRNDARVEIGLPGRVTYSTTW